MEHVNVVNVIGAGLAGLSCAVTLAERGVCCNLISVQPSERAQSVMAEGGINAAVNTMGENDSPENHFTDTVKGGVELADPNAVYGLVSHAPEIVRWLVKIGVPFEMKDGVLTLRNFGGQKKKRTAYAKSSTGKAIMSAMIDEARKYEVKGLICRYPHHEVKEPVFLETPQGKSCAGVRVFDRFTETESEIAGPVVLACGGLNGLFPGKTTGTVHNTGALTAAYFAAGGRIGNPEFIQYHPTTVSIPGKRMLISEAARGEGGRLFVVRDGKPWYFMEELFPELGNLMPRDVVSRESVKVCARKDCEGQVYLDMTGLSKEVLLNKLSDMREEILEYLSTDIAEEPVKVAPGIHFFMGGILVDEHHRTDFGGLYAAGECACQYHGANRLGGNSMLGAIYGGRVAAVSAAEDLLDGSCRFVSADWKNASDGSSFPPGPDKFFLSRNFCERLGSLLFEGLGIIRTPEGMQQALSELETWLKEGTFTEAEKNNALLGKAMLLAAIARKESRGAHYRSDYPDKNNDQFRKTTVATLTNGQIIISFQDIPERRD